MDDKLRQRRRSLVRITTMPAQQLGKEAELGYRKVGRQRCLLSFLPDDPDTDVCRLYHRDVIPTITDAANPFLGMFPDQSSHVSFLGRRASTSDNRRELGRQLDELVTEVIDAQLDTQSVRLGPSEHKGQISLEGILRQ